MGRLFLDSCQLQHGSRITNIPIGEERARDEIVNPISVKMRAKGIQISVDEALDWPRSNGGSHFAVGFQQSDGNF